jgi:hypothetical protein
MQAVISSRAERERTVASLDQTHVSEAVAATILRVPRADFANLASKHEIAYRHAHGGGREFRLADLEALRDKLVGALPQPKPWYAQ